MSSTDTQAAINHTDWLDLFRLVVDLFAIVTFALWGFLTWTAPYNWILGLGAPLVAILLWALFRSPKAVIHLDIFGRGLIEAVVMMAAALAWWQLGAPVVAIILAVIATASGILYGRRELR